MKRLNLFFLLVLATALPFQAWAQYEEDYEDVFDMGVIYRVHYDTQEAEVLHYYFTGDEYSYSSQDSVLDIRAEVNYCKVTKICSYAFSGCDQLKNVFIPTSLELIEDHAFEYSNIKTLSSYPGSFDTESPMLSIKEYAFYECPRLESFFASDMAVAEIGDCAFYNCASLSTFSINAYEGTITTLGKGCFSCCSSLTSFTIPRTVTTIDNAAFSHCTNLSYVSFPNTLITIGKFAFAECHSLASMTLPNRLETIETGAFMNCDALKSVTIPHTVTSLGGKAFGACRSLTTVRLSNNLTAIGERAFAGCYALTGINIPNKVKTIGDRAFTGAEFRGITDYDVFNPGLGVMQEGVYDDFGSMQNITIGSSVETIGTYAFVGHPLQSVTVMAAVPPVLYTGVAIDNPTVFDTLNFDNATLYVPRVMVDVYRTAHEWEYFTHIEGIEVLSNGDVNGDSQTNVSDVTEIINSLLNEDTSDINLINSDLNGDGVINVTDITLLVSQLLAAN